MKNLLGYLTCVAVAILLRVYINGSGGTLVLYLLAIAFVISLAALLITKRKLVAAIKLSTEISAKNEEFDADIMLLNAIRIIPSCVVEVTAECSDNIGAVSPLEFKTIVAGGRQQSVSVKLKTRYAGLGTVKIKSIRLHDYLGIITLHLDSSRYEKAVGKIKIMPNIPDTGSQTELLKATSENASFDDNESESDENALGLTGVPGYDHRQYEISPTTRVPADSSVFSGRSCFSGRLRPFCFFFNRFHKTVLAFAEKFAILELQCHTIAGGGAVRPGPSAKNTI